MAYGTKNQFTFQSSCLLPQAEVLRYAVIGRLNGTKAKSFAVDLSQVEDADISLLQILVSLRRTAMARAVTLTVASNAYVDDLLARAGLSDWAFAASDHRLIRASAPSQRKYRTRGQTHSLRR